MTPYQIHATHAMDVRLMLADDPENEILKAALKYYELQAARLKRMEDMTQTKHNGGPAFARNGQDHLDTQNGMSLRDYFAGQYIAGIFGGEPGSHLRPERAAIDAYAVADAMIAAREGGVQ